SKIAIATPTSPAQASAVVAPSVSRTYLTEVPTAMKLARNTSDERPSRSVARTSAPEVSSAAAPNPHDRRPARSARAPDPPAVPAACWTRKYVPDPARNMPLRFTPFPAPTPGTSGRVAGSAPVLSGGLGQRVLSVP